MAARIFISYRRDDAAGEAGRLSDHLIQRFGAASVFLDIDTIQPGADFVVTLESSLQETGVMLVVIGRRWLGDGGRRRLDDAGDFVRLELERALSRAIPIVPVLVQGATMPSATDLPATLAAFSKRQSVTLDHAEFRHDADRLSDHIAKVLGVSSDTQVPSRRPRWVVAGVAGLALILVGAAAYWTTRGDATAPATPTNVAPLTRASRDTASTPPSPATASTPPTVPPGPGSEVALAEATAQRQRHQYAEALATLATALQRSPDSEALRRLQEDVAMDLIRNVAVQQGGTFGEAIKPGLAIIDRALPTATAARRADLMAHSGWATFLFRRDGDGRLDPSGSYRDALKIDPGNPFANAMLAHWMIWHDDDLTGGVPLFLKAEVDRRAIDAVRQLEWGALSTLSVAAADVERVRLADRMRRAGEALNDRQLSTLRSTYFQHSLSGREERRAQLLQALPPDDHLALLSWAFGAGDTPGNQPLIRLYEALLHAEAGRTPRAINDLQQLRTQLASSPGSLQDAVTASLRALRAERGQAAGSRQPRARPQ